MKTKKINRNKLAHDYYNSMLQMNSIQYEDINIIVNKLELLLNNLEKPKEIEPVLYNLINILGSININAETQIKKAFLLADMFIKLSKNE